MNNNRQLFWIPLVTGVTAASLLILSFLAAYTETLMLDISAHIYALLRSFCHQMPSHCLWYANSNYGVCSHCFGILSGVTFMSAGVLYRNRSFDAKGSVSVVIMILSMLPLAADVWIDVHNRRMNPHPVRLAAGFSAGSGFSYFFYFILFKIKQFIQNKGGRKMTKRIVGVMIALLAILPPNITLPLAYAQSAVSLKRGTPVALRVTQMVTSETSHIGDMVHLEVLRDVTIDGKVVIEAGTPAEGEVVSASDRGFIGEPGRVGIAVNTTKAIDGQTVYLRSTLHREGQDKQTLSLVLGIIICFLFLFLKGKEAEISSGSEVKAYVDNDLSVAPKS